MNILINKSLDTFPSILVPVSIISLRPVFLSITIRAPIFCLEREATASTISSTTWDMFSSFTSTKDLVKKSTSSYIF